MAIGSHGAPEPLWNLCASSHLMSEKPPPSRDLAFLSQWRAGKVRDRNKACHGDWCGLLRNKLAPGPGHIAEGAGSNAHPTDKETEAEKVPKTSLPRSKGSSQHTHLQTGLGL